MRLWCASLLLAWGAVAGTAQDAAPATRGPASGVTSGSRLSHFEDAAWSTGHNPVLERVLSKWPAGNIDTVAHPGEWSYEKGVLLDGIVAEWRQTGDGRLFDYLKSAVDANVAKDGTIHLADGRPFPSAAHSLDDIEMGRSIIVLYRVLQDAHYYTAAKFLHDQIQVQPRTPSGGYWHKQAYPDQMWLDGAYMAEPFMASYARTFGKEAELSEVATQLLLMDSKLRDRKTNLLRHGWDESKKEQWADKTTGLSSEVWARAMGWYAMALIEVLERLPDDDPQRAALVSLAQRIMTTVIQYQDTATGLWWQVLDKGPHEGEAAVKGNFPEASASCMFVYALAKGVRLGVLPLGMIRRAALGWKGIQTHFVKPNGVLTGTVKVGGLGGNPYRNGSFAYYIGEPTQDNDAKGVGAYLLADSEMLQLQRAGDLAVRAHGRTAAVDGWFNSQTRKTADGRTELFHYKFNDDANSGYSVFARMFQQYGMRTDFIPNAPRAADLKDVAVYVIVSPDIPALNPNPHYMDKDSADAIEAWVKAGGVLMLMENDNQHSEFEHFDMLADRFGIHFNSTIRNQQIGDSYANTIVNIPAGTGGSLFTGAIFKDAHKAVEKEICTMTLSGPAKAVLTDKGDVIMAVAHVGKGWVYANADPWIYNEYTDGRKLPLGEDNFAAGQELVRWIVSKIPEKAPATARPSE
jgi:unsaturated rhamnogalacturonyl hydrolase